jgi:hypothetical protein
MLLKRLAAPRRLSFVVVALIACIASLALSLVDGGPGKSGFLWTLPIPAVGACLVPNPRSQIYAVAVFVGWVLLWFLFPALIFVVESIGKISS